MNVAEIAVKKRKIHEEMLKIDAKIKVWEKQKEKTKLPTTVAICENKIKLLKAKLVEMYKEMKRAA